MSDGETGSPGTVLCPHCGSAVHGLDREVTLGLPDVVFELAPSARTKRVVQQGKSLLVLDGEKCFLRVLLPVPLDIGHEFRFGVWMEISKDDFERINDVWDDPTFGDIAVDGTLQNAVPPWGDSVLGAPCHAAARNATDTLYIDRSPNETLSRILTTPWSVHECEELIQAVWGD